MKTSKELSVELYIVRQILHEKLHTDEYCEYYEDMYEPLLKQFEEAEAREQRELKRIQAIKGIIDYETQRKKVFELEKENTDLRAKLKSDYDEMIRINKLLNNIVSNLRSSINNVTTHGSTESGDLHMVAYIIAAIGVIIVFFGGESFGSACIAGAIIIFIFATANKLKNRKIRDTLEQIEVNENKMRTNINIYKDIEEYTLHCISINDTLIAHLKASLAVHSR